MIWMWSECDLIELWMWSDCNLTVGARTVPDGWWNGTTKPLQWNLLFVFRRLGTGQWLSSQDQYPTGAEAKRGVQCISPRCRGHLQTWLWLQGSPSFCQRSSWRVCVASAWRSSSSASCMKPATPAHGPSCWECGLPLRSTSCNQAASGQASAEEATTNESCQLHSDGLARGPMKKRRSK